MTIALLAVGCEKTIEFKGEITAPMLVVNSIIAPDSTIEVEVTASRFFLDNDMGPKYIENAALRLIVNDKDRGKLVKSPLIGTYETDYKVSAGDEVRIEVSASGYESVCGKTKIPVQPIILSVDTAITYTKKYDYYGLGYGSTVQYDTLGEFKSQDIRFSMKFKDNGKERNYYRLIVKKRIYLDKNEPQGGLIFDGEYIEDYLINFDDIVFKDQNQMGGIAEEGDDSYSYNYSMFSDELINGKEYELKFTDNNVLNYVSYQDNINRPNPEKVVYLIYLQEVSSDYYLYIKSMVAASKIDGNPFVEPVQVFSNIENGIGILGSYSSSKPFVIEVKH